MNLIKFLVAIKVEDITLPAMIALATLNDRHQRDETTMFIGEAHAFFHSTARTLGYDASSWTYGGVAYVLNRLHVKGLVTKRREGRYLEYGMAPEGLALMERVSTADTPEHLPLNYVFAEKGPCHKDFNQVKENKAC